MSKEHADFLVEIGTEELPPKALRRLETAFRDSVLRGIDEQRLRHGDAHAYSSPRRLAVLVESLALGQEDREVTQKGPPVKVAFDDNGNATPAAEAFAKKCGVDVADLERVETDKGAWLSCTVRETGHAASELLPGIVDAALQTLPAPRRMRWGDNDSEFVRPVHWVLMMHGKQAVECEIMGLATSNTTMGHRFLTSGPIEIRNPGEYLEVLEQKGFVIADFDAREQSVREQVEAQAERAGGNVRVDDSLYEEVAALTEWPVAMTGHFDEEFLELPPEVIVASLTGHQRYFPVSDGGDLLPSFVVVANLESEDPSKVRDGNEKVIRPRLADAAFFWNKDRNTSLADRFDELGKKMIYQEGLGTLQQKTARLEKLCKYLANELGYVGRRSGDAATYEHARRAAQLCKADLFTGMVGEFPELQGTMGSYYARADGESDEVAAAIGEHYQPRFAGDAVPATAPGQLLALADKLDTLAGVFALGKKPSGNKDPFGLRRAALGVVRILTECNLDLSPADAIREAVALQPIKDVDHDAVTTDLIAYVGDRLRSYYTDRPEVSAEMFDAVAGNGEPGSIPLPDFEQRMRAVQAFAGMAESESLAAANKRISNILQKAAGRTKKKLDEKLLSEDAEKDLWAALGDALSDVKPMQEARDYENVLARLAGLRKPVDRFFDEVMVMTEDDAVRNNRLTLLTQLREPFRSVADISRLSVGAREGKS